MADNETQRLAGGFCAPADLLIVGVDDVPDIGDNADLLDPDRLDGPSEGLIQSIMAHGVKQAVQVRSRRFADKRLKLVIDGRQRTLAAREADRRLRKQGDDAGVRVPYIILDSDADGVIIANEHRRDDPTWVRAKKAALAIKRGSSPEEVCTMFGEGGQPISKQTLGNWQRLVKCSPEILDRIKTGELSVTMGYEIGKHPHAKQGEILSTLLGSGASLTGTNGIHNVKAAAAMPELVPDRTTVDPGPSTSPAPPKAPRAPKDPSTTLVRDQRLSAKRIETIVEILSPTETEPFENDEQKLTYTIFGVAAGLVPVSALSEWPWIHKIVEKACK